MSPRLLLLIGGAFIVLAAAAGLHQKALHEAAAASREIGHDH